MTFVTQTGLEISGTALLIAAVGFFAGAFVKGAIGFALPTVALTVSAMVLPPQVAVAVLALPTLMTNIWQSGRDGVQAGLETLRDFRLMLAVMFIVLFLSTQLLPYLSERSFTTILGAGISAFALAQLLGWKPAPPRRPRSDILVGAIAGMFGGISGIWGPPILLFMIALGLEKRALVRAAGIAFMLGSIPFIAGHLASGLLNASTLWLSGAFCAPVIAGMRFGQMVQDRIDGATLRRLILIVLVLAGLNFLRRGLF